MKPAFDLNDEMNPAPAGSRGNGATGVRLPAQRSGDAPDVARPGTGEPPAGAAPGGSDGSGEPVPAEPGVVHEPLPEDRLPRRQSGSDGGAGEAAAEPAPVRRPISLSGGDDLDVDSGDIGAPGKPGDQAREPGSLTAPVDPWPAADPIPPPLTSTISPVEAALIEALSAAHEAVPAAGGEPGAGAEPGAGSSAPEPPPRPPRRPGLAWPWRWRRPALVAGIVAALVLLTAGVLASGQFTDDNRDRVAPTDEAGGAGTATVGTAAEASTSMAESPGAGPSARAPQPGPAASTGAASPSASASVTHRTGSLRIAVVLGGDDGYDLDNGRRGTAGTADLAGAALGIVTRNGAALAPWSGGGTPTKAGCAALPADAWSDTVVLPAIVPGSRLCVRTNERRLGALTVTGLAPLSGGVTSVDLDYLVWAA